MTYDQLINAVEAALKPLAQAAGGDVLIAESLEKAKTYLEAAPNRWRVILHWEGYGEHPEARMGMTYHQITTVIQAPDGLIHRPGEHTTKPKPSGAVPFSTHISRVTGWMTALRFPNGTGADVAGFAPAGSLWVSSASKTTAHALNWKLTAALPAFPTTIPLEFPHLI